MKKAIVLVAVFLVLAWSTGAFGAGFVGTKKLNIPQLAGAPAIDGAGSDAAWSGAVSVNLTDRENLPEILPSPSQADTFVTASVGWYGKSIFLKFDITDDSFDHSAWGTDVNSNWKTDSIEVLLDLNGLQRTLGDGAAQMASYDATGGPCQIRAAVWDDGGAGFYNMVAFNSATALAQVSYSATAVPSVLTGRWVAAHTLGSGSATQEIELQISDAALAAAGASGLADIDSFGLILSYNDSDASGAPAPPNGGTLGTGTRDAQVLWWGGPSNTPSGGVVTYNPALPALAFYSTSDGTFAEAGFVGAGEGGLVDKGPAPTFIEMVNWTELQATMEPLAGAGTVLLGLPTTIPDTVTIYWMTMAMMNPLMSHSSETLSAFAHNGQVLLDAGMTNAADLGSIGIPMLITAGEPYLSALVGMLQGAGLSISAGDFVTVPYFTDGGDYDGNGGSNADEYTPGDPLGFIESQLPRLPVAGVVALGLLISACGLGGLVKLRKK
jgi:hypothetical protein